MTDPAPAPNVDQAGRRVKPLPHLRDEVADFRRREEDEDEEREWNAEYMAHLWRESERECMG